MNIGGNLSYFYIYDKVPFTINEFTFYIEKGSGIEIYIKTST